MKKWLTLAVALFIALAAAFAYWQWSAHSLSAAVEKTRRQLRQQNFRTDISDFNFALPSEVNARVDAILAAGQAVRSMRHAHDLMLMETVGTNAALAISSVEVIETPQATNLWPLIKEELRNHNAVLDRACAALSAGPVKFQPMVKPRGDILLPYAADVKTIARALAVRSVLAMHEQNTNDVFTNLFALSRLVTGWDPEPFDIAHLVRFACQGFAQQAIWESMQTDCWNETQLAALQREWESLRFFDGLPETAELSCANMTRMCQTAREERYSTTIGEWWPLFRSVFQQDGFRNLWSAIQGYRQHTSYRNGGSYEDEKALLLYYRERHEELKRAIACSTWTEMRSSPGTTNSLAFTGAKFSRIVSIMNLKRMSLSMQTPGQTILSRAAEAETQRRLIVTAIALERFAIEHKAYPESLARIVPAFLPAVPVDFMDGKELRYRRLNDRRYLLYSVGLDGLDNGGQIVSARSLYSRRRSPRFPPRFETDIVWPLPATQADVDAFERKSTDSESEPEEKAPNL